MQASRSPARRLLVVLVAFIGFSASSFAGRAPLVTVSVIPASITNESQDAVFTLTLSAPSSKNVPVTFVMTGLAVQGFDYFLIGPFTNTGQAVIPAGQLSKTVTLHTIPDDPNPFRETATLNVINGRGYHVGHPNSATVFIFPQP